MLFRLYMIMQQPCVESSLVDRSAVFLGGGYLGDGWLFRYPNNVVWADDSSTRKFAFSLLICRIV